MPNRRGRTERYLQRLLVASHHGRRSGIYPQMFIVYGCAPKLVVISDDYKQYDTQETTSFFGLKTIDIYGFG